MTKGAPFRVTALVWLVLWFTMWNALRLWTAIDWRIRLEEFASRPGALYIGGTGAFFAVLGLGSLWSLFRDKTWSQKLIVTTALVYSAWYWADRLLLQQEHTNWLFALVANLLVLAFIWISLRSWFFRRQINGRDSAH